MSSSSTSNHHQSQHEKCIFMFNEWMNIQELDLSELLTALQQTPSTSSNTTTAAAANDQNPILSGLVEKTITRFEQYIEKRKSLSRIDASGFYAPTWCTSLENSLLWIGGCRPSMFIRLMYYLCGSDIESRMSEYLEGIKTSNLSDLSGSQLASIDDLQNRTIREEDRLSSRLASLQVHVANKSFSCLQENIADKPFPTMAKNPSQGAESNQEQDATRAVDEQVEAMGSLIEEADKLRMSIFKELLSVLTPVQGVEFLVASKQLHLSIHIWGIKRDDDYGR